MKFKQPKYYLRYLAIFIVIIFSAGLFIFTSITIRIATARFFQPQPQAILTLGGSPQREEFTAWFAQFYPSLPIWVSSGFSEAVSRQIFRDAGISSERVHLDNRATDTVTNFTTLVADFKSQNIQHLYLITSDYHLPRAKAIGYIVLGSQGIAFTPIAVASEEPPEAKIKIRRDTARALLWLFTRHTGSSLKTR
ncbi:YdcF family protein [Myxosarcina sp. GI1]|uniref:YdcF family protein n=1 Tax=Myxosarcina sp. GI1 TaxID=1541065 RepID=UPI0006912F56|nr:YdcF family protein [Myxosarcina sp. GI1]